MGAKNSTEKMLKSIDNLFEEKVDSDDKNSKLKVGKKDKKEYNKEYKKKDKKNEPIKCKLCGEK